MKYVFTLAICMAFQFSTVSRGQEGIPISDLKRNSPVDFDKEVLPLLRQNCLACHNSTDAEGDVILESVSKILESEAVVAGKPDESSMLTLSAHLDDPVMPPEDNEVKAKNMTSEQLGLIKLWIVEGAKPSKNSTANQVQFAALPPGVNPVYALSMSPNGQFVAAGRANQIFVYRIPGKKLVERVTDPNLLKTSPYKKPGVAHLDIVQSLAFSPDNKTFVSGGFRNVKVWSRNQNSISTKPLSLSEPVSSSGRSANNRWVILGGSQGGVFLCDMVDGSLKKTIKTGEKPIDIATVQDDGTKFAVISEKKVLSLYDVTTTKMIGASITLDQDAVGMAIANKNSQILVALANNTIAVFGIDQLANPKEEKAAPLKILTGHSQPARLLKPYGQESQKLLSAGKDGMAKLWDLNSGQAAKSFTHGGEIAAVEISDDETRVVTCGANGSLKIFDTANSTLIKEIRGDAGTDYQVARNDREVRLKQQLIDVAKGDVDAAKKEKTAEDGNVKKTEEALKKADEDLKQKLAAKMKADEAFDKANKDFTAKKAELTNLEKSVADFDSKIKAANENLKKIMAELAEVTANIKTIDTAMAATQKQLELAKANVAKDANNDEFKKAVDVATKAVAEKQKEKEGANAAKVASDNKVKTTNDTIQSLTTMKNEAGKKLATVKAEVGKLEPNVKKLTDEQKKASDAHTASIRNQSLAKNSVDRAKARAKTVSDKIPALEKSLQSAESNKKSAEKLSQDFKASSQNKLTALVNLAKIEDDILVYQDAQGNLGSCDFISGEKLDSVSFPPSANNPLFFAHGKQLVSFSSDWKKINLMAWDSGWHLVRTIGGIDDVATFVDRVTALDISADGSLLATGTGEPSRSGVIKIWNLADGKLVRELKDAHSDTILDLKFSPDSLKLASASSDRFMKTFSLSDGKMIRVFEGHTHHVMSVDWNSTGRVISTAGADKVVKVWDAETGTQKRTISGFGKEVTALRFVELSSNIVTACGDKTVHLKRTDNGGQVRSFSGNADYVYSVDASADGKKIAAAGEDSVVRVWSENGQLEVEYVPPATKSSTVSSK